MSELSLPPHAAAALESMCELLSRLPLRPLALVAIGSVTLPGRWNPESSDIDLCVYIDPSWEDVMIPAARILQSCLVGEDVSVTVPPHALIDLQNNRVETVISHLGVSFDLTWLTGVDTHVGTSWYDIRRDHLEIHIGALYTYGVVLSGVRPRFPRISPIHPYYPDDLRMERLGVLRAGIGKTFDQLRRLPPTATFERLIRIHSATVAFLQALFMSRRIYPASYEKHIGYQLTELLSLPEASVNALRLGAESSGKEVTSVEEEWMSLLSV